MCTTHGQPKFGGDITISVSKKSMINSTPKKVTTKKSGPKTTKPVASEKLATTMTSLG
jgi:hypothetical protein